MFPIWRYPHTSTIPGTGPVKYKALNKCSWIGPPNMKCVKGIEEGYLFNHFGQKNLNIINK